MLEDVVELEVDGTREADARDIGPVEQGVGYDCDAEENEAGGNGEEGGEVGAAGGAGDG